MQIVMLLQRKHYVVNGFFALMYGPHLSEGLVDHGDYNYILISHVFNVLSDIKILVC